MSQTDNIIGADAEALATALRERELELHYQPKIALGSNELTGVEALARWRHPKLGFIPPTHFIPLAESAGLIDAITEWVIAEGARQWSEWHAAGLTTRIAVNISAVNLGHIDFPDLVGGILRSAKVNCAHFEIELTESATQNAVNLLDTLTRLRLKGIHLAIDDFGTGYSSLLQLQRLPFSSIKIDRSFVGNADRSEDCRVIIRSVIDLAHNLGMEAVAEGVETETTLQLLRDLGCDVVQGYFVGRPMPGPAMLDFDKDWRLRHPAQPKTGPVEIAPARDRHRARRGA